MLIGTGKGSAAVIESSGSRIEIAADSLLTFEGGDLSLDHGSLSIYTSRGVKVRVGCLMISPVNEADWTRYEVTDVNSTVVVSAVQSDVYIDAGGNEADRKAAASGREVIHQGEQKSRDEKCTHSPVKPALSGIGPILDSPWAIGTGTAAIIALTCFALCQSSQPLSPKDP